MQERLPDIEELLAKNKFSEENLEAIKGAINRKYQNSDLRKEVISTVSQYLRNFGIDFNSHFYSSELKDGKRKIISGHSDQELKGTGILPKNRRKLMNKTESKIPEFKKLSKSGNIRNKSLTQQFSEIEAFFTKDTFSEDELESLKDAVEHEYRNDQMRKAASSLIALHLVKFQIKLRGGNNSLSEENRKSGIIPKKHKLRGLHRNWEKVKDEDVTEIADRFGIPLPTFLEGLKKLGFENRLERKFTFKEFKTVYIFITESISEIQLENRKRKKVERSTQKIKNAQPKKYRKAGTGTIPEKRLGIKTYNTKSTRSISVFDKIHGEGGLKKIIYTRM